MDNSSAFLIHLFFFQILIVINSVQAAQEFQLEDRITWCRLRLLKFFNHQFPRPICLRDVLELDCSFRWTPKSSPSFKTKGTDLSLGAHNHKFAYDPEQTRLTASFTLADILMQHRLYAYSTLRH